MWITFSTGSSLEIHIKTDTVEQPYSYEVYGSFLSTSFTLKQMQTHCGEAYLCKVYWLALSECSDFKIYSQLHYTEALVL